jgi:streptogramin lyase
MQLHYSLPLTALMATLLGMPSTAVAQQQYGIVEYVLAGVPGLPSNSLASNMLARGPDGYVWFVGGDGAIYRITPSGATTRFPVPGGIWALTAGPDGALWFELDVAIGATSFNAIGHDHLGRRHHVPPAARLAVWVCDYIGSWRVVVHRRWGDRIYQYLRHNRPGRD